MPSLIMKERFVYGTELFYPINDTARAFAKLIGKKTLSILELTAIKDLGHQIDFQSSTLTV